jgi:hypothetical protein
MNFRLKCEKPGEIEYTITATMTAAQWEQVRERIEATRPNHFDGYEPAGRLVDAINDLLAQARKIYWPSIPAETGEKHGS